MAQRVLNPSVVAKHCKWHPRAWARFSCPRCNLYYCDLCVETRVAGGVVSKHCRKCGGECEPVSVHIQPVATPRPPFAATLPGAFSYPFKGNGVILLVAGAVFFLLLGFLPFIGLLIGGYLFSYAKRIVVSSAGGEAEPPDWPDFTNWVDDILLPYGHLFALVVLSFGPAWVAAQFLPTTEWYYRATVITATVVGGFLAPMGMLALAMFDTVTALNPMALVWSILKIPGQYLIAAIAFELVIGGYVLCETFLAALVPVPFVGDLVAGCVSLYLLAVAMRILGLLYWSKQDQLGWHGRRKAASAG